MQRNLTKGPITVNLLLFALPLMFGNLLQQLYNVADTWVGSCWFFLYTYDIFNINKRISKQLWNRYYGSICRRSENRLLRIHASTRLRKCIFNLRGTKLRGKGRKMN